MSRRRPKGRRSFLSVYGAEELQAAVLAMKLADRDLRNDINRRARATMGPEWKAGLSQHLRGIPQQQVIVKGAKISTGNPPSITTATTKTKVGHGGGIIPVDQWPVWEYGVSQHYPHQYTRRSRSGRSHTVRRDVNAGAPPRRKNGYVIGPTLADLLPRLASLWVQTIVRTYMDALEQGSE